MEKFLKRIIWIIIIAPAIYLAISWNSLPEKVAIHFDLKGNIDRYGSRNELLIMIIVLTAITALIYTFLPNIYRIDPKKQAAENKSSLYRITVAIVIFLTAVYCLILYSSIHGNTIFSSHIILAGIGLLLATIGNYMHTIKPNFFAGIRLPWTLSNDENWRKTHLLGGKLFFCAGLLLAVVCLFTSFLVSMIILTATIVLLTIIICIYSYRIYRKQKILSGN